MARRALPALTLAAAVVLAACGGAATGDGEQPALGDGQFTGPWAVTFETAYTNAQSDFVREVLRDGQVTDQEIVEMWQRITECAHAAGWDDITVTVEQGVDGVSPSINFGTTVDLGGGSRHPKHLDFEACQERYDGSRDDFTHTLTGINHDMRFHAAGPLSDDARLRETMACFQRRGFLPDAMSFEEFDLLLDPCRTPTSPDGVQAAWDTGCWVQIIELDGRTCEEVSRTTPVAHGSLCNDAFWLEWNPDAPQPDFTFPDGRSMDDPEAQVCWVNPSRD